MLKVWRVTFEYLFEVDGKWQRDVALTVGDEHGGKAANYVHEKMLGSEVTVSRYPSPSPFPLVGTNAMLPVQQACEIIDWRLVGLEDIGALNFLDMSTLEAAGLFELIDSQKLCETCEATEKPLENQAGQV